MPRVLLATGKLVGEGFDYPDLEGRVLDFDRPSAEAAAALAAERQRKGRAVDIRDTQIAGIVIGRRAKLATRNIKHFSDLSVEVVNPWQVR